MKYRYFLVGSAIFASAVLGDYCNVKDRFIEPMKYRNIKVDSEGYQKPFQLGKKYRINEKGYLEVYIGNSNTWYKVDKELRANERSFSEQLNEESKKVKSYLKGKFDSLRGWYERNFKNEYRN